MNYSFVVVILVANFTYKYLSAEVVLSELLLAPTDCHCKWSCVCFIIVQDQYLVSQTNEYRFIGTVLTSECFLCIVRL